MRRLIALAVAPALLSAAPLDAVGRARAEAAASEAEARRLEDAVSRADDEVAKIRAARTAAAAQVAAAEAQLAAAAVAQAALQRIADASAARLAEAQRPAAQLLAGLVQIGRRPPLLALADRASLDEFIRARALLDASLPVIRARSAALAAQMEADRRVASAAASARPELIRRRQGLAQAQARFAAMEATADTRLTALGGQALEAGDRALTRGEGADAVAARIELERTADRRAAALSALAEAPPRPSAAEGSARAIPIEWRLPADAKVTNGLLEISDNGVRSRGLVLATRRGADILAPAAGRIVFAGPFRRHEGVLILDHGGGWMTLLTDVRTPLAVGATIEARDAVGKALGPIGVELRHNGTTQPAALIAGSSRTLSKSQTAG